MHTQHGIDTCITATNNAGSLSGVFAAMPRFTFGQRARPPVRSEHESNGDVQLQHASGTIVPDLQFGLLVAGLSGRS